MSWFHPTLKPTRHHCRRFANSNGSTSFISRRNAASWATKNIGTISTSSSGDSLRRNGTSMMRRSIAAPRPSTMRMRVMATARHTLTAVPTQGNSRADTHTRSSTAASSTTRLRKRPGSLPMPSSKLTVTDRV